MYSVRIKSNLFDLSNDYYGTCDMGQLIPVDAKIVNPGDTFRMESSALVRLQPLVAPQMTPINVRIDYFFVPLRLLWKNWEKFITGGPDGMDDSVKPKIIIPEGGFKPHSLADYFGIEPGKGAGVKISALFYRAYNKIWNEWYRDENLQEEVGWSDGDGDDTETSTELLYRCWQKDRFTNSLPWAQRGNSVSLPLGSIAPVKGNGKVLGLFNGTTYAGLKANGSDGLEDSAGLYGANVGETNATGGQMSNLTGIGITTDSTKSGMVADLSEATSAPVNDLRKAFQVQKWMERNARAGVRYIEFILAHFGVKSSDARLQRSEYLGGGKSPVVVSEVLQTSSSDSTSPQGNMAGHGFSVPKTIQFTRGFEEYGILMSLMSIVPRSSYMNGLEKKWSLNSRYDYYFPEFCHLGEQPVKNQEVYLQDASVKDEVGNSVNECSFGFQGIYDEYRHSYSYVTGDFRNSLKQYTLARDFAEMPKLNSDFVTCKPSKRIFAVTDENVNSFMFHIYHNCKALRLMPKYAEPGLIDHM